MASVARVVEAVGVGAYLGGSVLIDDKSVLVAAASILTIEARHQSFLNVLNGANAIPQPFDIPLTPGQVLALAGGFIQGCSALGIPANPALAITNTDVPKPGTTLTFSSPALNSTGDQQLSCQMITGGNTTALSFPMEGCIVPEGINGPVAIFVTNDPQPIVAGKDSPVIIAGPTIIFIDAPDALGSLVRNGADSVQLSDQLTPSQASDVLSSYTGAILTETGAATTDSSGAVATETSAAPTDASAAPTDSIATDSAVPTESLAASDSAATPTDSASSDASDATPAEADTAPTSAPEGPIVVLGQSTVCVSCLSSEAFGLVY